MEILLVMIIALLVVIVLTLAIMGHNNDQYHATAISAEDFIRLFDQLGNPPVFQKKIFFITFLVIPHNGILVATKKKNLPSDFITKVAPYSCLNVNRHF
ncbi:MAG: hypothetical protein KAG98_05935 [Lentisphaeria bacterium]|nr:hypothetical protein [Lentisphaeria bacterium]